MIKVYTASKLKHAEKWKSIVIEGVEFVARWPRLHVGNIPDDASYAKVFWQHDLEDVARADVILVYAEAEEHLRGALVEAGMAIALNKIVVVVGTHPDYGTWQHHPLVYKVDNLDAAAILFKCMNMTWPA